MAVVKLKGLPSLEALEEAADAIAATYERISDLRWGMPVPDADETIDAIAPTTFAEIGEGYAHIERIVMNAEYLLAEARGLRASLRPVAEAHSMKMTREVEGRGEQS